MASFPGLALMMTLALGQALAQAEVAIVRGPYLQSLLSDSVRILWLTDAATVGRVELTASDGPPRIVVEAEASTRHEVEVTGLQPDTAYTYVVFAAEVALTEEFGFRTAPPAGTGSLRAVVIGDSGNKNFSFQGEVAGLLEELEPDLFLHAGDLIYSGTLDEVVFEMYRSLLSRVGMYPARGNHARIPVDEWFGLFAPPDVARELPGCELPPEVCADDTTDPVTLPERRRGGFYSFDWGPAHFAVVDSVSEFPIFSECSLQFRWLCNDLAEARNRGMPWLVLLLHHTVYTAGLHAIDEPRAERLVPPIAERFGVDLVLSGHDHNYQRTFPVRGGATVDTWQEPSYTSPQGPFYVVTGGGGTGLYFRLRDAAHAPLLRVFEPRHHATLLEFTPDAMRVRAVTPSGEVLDDLHVAKGEPRIPGFLRGDVNFDGTREISDGIALLSNLFLGESSLCPGAFDVVADTDGSRDILLGDAIYLFSFLFLGGGPMATPFRECEPAPELAIGLCESVSCEF